MISLTSRPTMPDVLHEVARLMATRSTCSRGANGGVAARDGRIVATGYNGAPAGMPHCEHLSWVKPAYDDPNPTPAWVHEKFFGAPPGTLFMASGDVLRLDRDGRGHEQLSIQHGPGDVESAPTCLATVHAEANLIAFAARHGVALGGTTLYVTSTPCLACAKLVINAGITRVEAAAAYRDPAGVDLLRDATIDVVIL